MLKSCSKLCGPKTCAACLVRCGLRVSICFPLLLTFYCFYQQWELTAETTQPIMLSANQRPVSWVSDQSEARTSSYCQGTKTGDNIHIHNSDNSQNQELGKWSLVVVTRLTSALLSVTSLRLFWRYLCVCCGVLCGYIIFHVHILNII